MVRSANLLQIISDVVLVGLRADVGLDLGVGIIDDCDEHVEENEEDKEDVGEEIERSQNGVGFLKFCEVEITQNNSKKSESVDRNNEKIQMKHILTTTKT